MPDIIFTVEDSTHSVRIDTIDPAVLYDSGDRVEEKLESLGYEFETDEKPDYEELSSVARQNGGDDIDLGDLTSRVTSIDEDDEPDGDVVVEVVGPDGARGKRGMDENQNVGALTAWINAEFDVDMAEKVQLYRDEARSDEIGGEAMARRFDGRTLYWDTVAQ